MLEQEVERSLLMQMIIIMIFDILSEKIQRGGAKWNIISLPCQL